MLLSTPLALLIHELDSFCRNLTDGSVVVASGDVLLHISMVKIATWAKFIVDSEIYDQDDRCPHIPNNGVSIIGVPEEPSTAKNHVSRTT